MSHYDAFDDGIVLCSSCRKPLDTEDDKQNNIRECPYSEDAYCHEDFMEHMEESHHFYYTKVLEIKTQHKSVSKEAANKAIRKFQRNGRVMQTAIYWIKQEHGSVPKFDYTEMSHDNFMEHHYPAFISLKNRDDSEASREAIC